MTLRTVAIRLAIITSRLRSANFCAHDTARAHNGRNTGRLPRNRPGSRPAGCSGGAARPLGQLDEVRADGVAHAARARVQHEPDETRLIQADLDEVVARAQRAQVLAVVGVAQARMQLAQRVELVGQRGPDLVHGHRRVLPAARVATAARRRAVRHGLLDGRAQRTQVVGRSSARSVVLAAIMPQPMSTPTAAGMMALRVGITEPTVAPMPRCTSGMAAMCLNTMGRRAALASWRLASSSTGTPWSTFSPARRRRLLRCCSSGSSC